MKTRIALAIATVTMVACTEPLSNAASREVKPLLVVQAFPGGSGTTAASDGWRVTSFPGGITTSALPISESPSHESFLGVFTNEIVTFDLTAPSGSGTANFDVYVLGTWDGSGKQGSFGPDTWQFGTYCSDGGAIDPDAIASVFWTSFSNQKVNTQNYPRQTTDPGSRPAGTKAFKINSLGYKGAGIIVTGARKDDFGDTIYRVSFAYSTSCASAEQAMLVFRTPPRNLQTVRDEAWGLDNVEVLPN